MRLKHQAGPASEESSTACPRSVHAPCLWTALRVSDLGYESHAFSECPVHIHYGRLKKVLDTPEQKTQRLLLPLAHMKPLTACVTSLDSNTASMNRFTVEVRFQTNNILLEICPKYCLGYTYTNNYSLFI